MGTKAGKEVNVIIAEFQALRTPVLLPPKFGPINMKTANTLPGKRQSRVHLSTDNYLSEVWK